MDITPYVAGNKLRIEVEEKSRFTYYDKAFEAAMKIAKALREE